MSPCLSDDASGAELTLGPSSKPAIGRPEPTLQSATSRPEPALESATSRQVPALESATSRSGPAPGPTISRPEPALESATSRSGPAPGPTISRPEPALQSATSRQEPALESATSRSGPAPGPTISRPAPAEVSATGRPEPVHWSTLAPATDGSAPALESASREGAAPSMHVLDEVAAFLKRFVVYPHVHALVAHVLWLAHTHAMEAWDSTPRLAFLSPEPGSGKTRALEITELLVPRPVVAINVSPAYLLRKISDETGLPTILFDEIDTVFGDRAREHEDIRGILNAGHRRGATAGRCIIVGKSVKTEEFPAYCPVAVAGLGHLPDTILTRAVVIRMRRRAPSDRVQPYRRREYLAEGLALKQKLADWIARHETALTTARPRMPPEVIDRFADVWEPLLAIADAADERWANAARSAATAFVLEAQDKTPSFGIRLLGDLQTLFAEEKALSSEFIVAELRKLEEAPWDDMRGKPLDPRRLAIMLREYGIRSKTIRLGTTTSKGYEKSDFADAWTRYLTLRPLEGVTEVTP